MVRLTLRMPDDVHEMLVKRATQQERSLNSEIVYVLKNSLNQEPPNGRELPGELGRLRSTENQEPGCASNDAT